MLKKLKFKQICAGLLSLTLLTMAIIPHIGKQEAKAFSSGYGICIDNHNVSTSGYWSKNDVYTNKLLDMNTYTYGTDEYKQALAHNVQVLHQLIGSDEQILKLFWAGIATWITEGKSFDGTRKDLQNAYYWANYASQGYQDSVWHNYAPDLGTITLKQMSELELGMVLHGSTGQQFIDRDPLLSMLANPDTLFSSDDWKKYPQALPRLSNAWLKSYSATTSGENGRGIWPKDVAGHEIVVAPGEKPTKEQVQIAALDMETNEAYKVDGEPGHYRIEMTEDFFNNCGNLMVFDEGLQMWRSMNNGANGWECKWIAQQGYWAYDFTFTGGNKPQPLLMYFEIPQNSVADPGAIGYDTPVEFAASFLKLYTCDSCGGTHNPGKVSTSQHQRFVAFNKQEMTYVYPCLRLGDPVEVPKSPDVALDFNIYRHTEEMVSNYNVQLEKKDYETGKPLENSIFELYERFDDKDEVNLERDGAVELYKGGDDTWQSKYTSSPVVWDDFRKVGSYTTDGNGHVEEDLKKNYHYEKTFCDGHPAPVFAAVPEPEEDEETGEIANEDEIEAAKEKNMEIALQWMSYRDDCESMSQDRDGVHFHWIMDDINVDVIEEVSSSGGEEGSTPNGGNTTSADVDTAYKESTCQQDCEDTYDKFINLEYSYTWIEARAREGYIRHDIHKDDVPIEVITTNSSEAGA